MTSPPPTLMAVVTKDHEELLTLDPGLTLARLNIELNIELYREFLVQGEDQRTSRAFVGKAPSG